MKKIVFILVILSYALSSQSQNEKQYYSEGEKQEQEKTIKQNKIFLEALKRNVLVVLEEENPKIVKELQKSEVKLAEYRKLIELNNKLLMELVPKFWRQDSATIEFKKYSECVALSKTGSNKYFTIEFSSLRDIDDFEAALVPKDPLVKRKSLLSKAGEFGKFEMKLIEKFKKSPFYDFQTITSIPNELDFIISIQMINNFFLSKYYDPTLSKGGYEGFIMEKHTGLQSKTLLVDSAQVVFTPGFKMKDLKENYPYSFELTGTANILNQVKAQNASYAYLAIIPYTSQTGKDNSFNNTAGGGMSESEKEQVASYTHYIIDCAGSEPLFLAKNQPRMVEKTGWKLNTTYILKLFNFKIVR